MKAPKKPRCPETVLHNGGRFQCRKDSGHENGMAQQHWALKPDGRDVVWVIHILTPKKEPT